MRTRALLLLVLSSGAASVAAVACGSSGEAPAPPPADIIGIGELPIALRNGAPEPQGAAKIEVSPTELRLDGTKLLALDHGAVATADLSGGVITKLRGALQSGPARRAAALHVHAATPWRTTAGIFATLLAANVHEAAIRVRKPGSADTGWLDVKQWITAPNADDAVDFAGITPMAWPELLPVLENVRAECLRVSEPINCMPTPEKLADGGRAQIVLRARGDGVKIELYQVGVDPAVVAAQAQAARPVPLIEGVRARPGELEEIPIPPATETAFTMRQDAATRVPSPISAMMRPICGSRACGVLLVGDAETMSMRLVSLLGAAFPDGAALPTVAFVVP